MLAIRLQRTGRRNSPTYRVVVTPKRAPPKSKHLEVVGYYLPAQKEGSIQLEQERIEHWVKLGAIPSDTMARLLKRAGMKNMDKFIKRYAKQRSKNAPEEVAAAPAPAAAAAPEAPAEAAAEPANDNA